MSNKTQLQTNNTTLDGYIARINAAKDIAASLPEAGGSSSGGDVETCIITLSDETGSVIWHYTDANKTLQMHTGSGSIIVLTNTLIIYTTSNYTYPDVNGNINLIMSYAGHGAAHAYGDGLIEFSLGDSA